jgi:hypothetical protein
LEQISKIGTNFKFKNVQIIQLKNQTKKGRKREKPKEK